MRQWLGATERRNARGENEGHVVGNHSGSRMIAIVGAHLEHLIANRTDFDGSAKALDQGHHQRMLCYGISVGNAAGTEQHGIDEVLISMRAIPVGLPGMEIEVNVRRQLEQLFHKGTQRWTQFLATHQIEANE